VHPITDKTPFIILGCDGIWDCITSKKCVKFFNERINQIDSFIPAVSELMDKIIAPELENCGGIGHDNMTCMII
jgi:serine/threonine protein phosphatase PrpC